MPLTALDRNTNNNRDETRTEILSLKEMRYVREHIYEEIRELPAQNSRNVHREVFEEENEYDIPRPIIPSSEVRNEAENTHTHTHTAIVGKFKSR